MNRFFGYIRVSTPKQGLGVSLQEQKDAIVRYCQRNRLEVTAWFEEQETAAKRGRAVFNQMLRDLQRGRADGVVIHKIDRSARNLKDWADLGELTDKGIEIHFANESLDLNSRGGRLSADIQAVVAADYIRNLREETRKGFYGRIKQGLYPLPAPLGYVDRGKGQLKQPDPATAPLVKKAFELYGSGAYNLDDLLKVLFKMGLRNRRGGKLSRTGLSTILNNPFYIGLIRLRRTKETFPGGHTPLISKSLFDRVHGILTGKTNARIQRHDFLFRKMVRCTSCRRCLIGSLHKSHIYYRCQTKSCPTTSLRQEMIEGEIRRLLSPLVFSPQEKSYFNRKIAKLKQTWVGEQETLTQSLKLRVGQLEDRLNRLTDAYIDRHIEKDLFEKRKTALLMEQKEVDEMRSYWRDSQQSVADRVAEFLELAGDAYLLYESAFGDEKRELVKTVTSNRSVTGKTLGFTLALPFAEVANRFEKANGAPYRDIPRTWDRLISHLIRFFEANSDVKQIDPCTPTNTA